jgi:hypothetical protein
MDGDQDIAPRARRWIEDPADLPWFDQPDALTRITGIADRWNLGAEGREWLTSWVRDGYFVAGTLIPSPVVDALSARIDDVWFRDAAIPGLWLCDILVGSTMHVSCQHADLLALPPADRIEAKARSNWRIPGYHQYEPAASDVFELDELKNVCSALFDRPAVPRYSLTFSKGSQQGLHQDISAFHVWPRTYLIGAWVACEDITIGSGPLVYDPGTHRSPMYPGFDNYPQTTRRTASPEHAAGYEAFVQAVARDYPRKEFLAKKGSVLFWHGMLIHGGSAITDTTKTRKSFVIHYMPDGVDRSSEVVGPFNW